MQPSSSHFNPLKVTARLANLVWFLQKDSPDSDGHVTITDYARFRLNRYKTI
jgi:hypothetical protein